MDIQINNSDKGLSYAIKRQLQAENVDVSKINSCWTQIMNAFKGDSESKVNGKTIAEQWNTLNAKVKITVNQFITIANNTWENIKSIVKKASGQDVQQLQQRTNSDGETEFIDDKGRVQKRTPRGYGPTCEYTYEGNSKTPSTEIQTESFSNEDGTTTIKKEYTYKYGQPPRITKESSNNTSTIVGDWEKNQIYEYSEQGVLLSSHSVSKCLNNPNGKPFTLINDYNYDSNGNVVKQIDKNTDGSIKRIVEWIYNDKNQKIHEKQTDGQGNLISETDITPDEESQRASWTSSRRTFGLEDRNQIRPNQPQTPEVRQVACTKTEMQQLEYKKVFKEAQSIVLNNKELLELSEKEFNLIQNIKIESITYGPSRYDLESKEIRFNINDFRTPDVNNFVILILHEAHHGEIDNYTRENAEEQEKTAETRGIEGAKKLYQNGIIGDFEVWGAKDEHKKISEFDKNTVIQAFVNKWFDEQYHHIHK